jgi:two-component sensor histidine kinase
MLKEMHHRVNNHMQVVSSMLSLSRAKISDIRARELVQESQHRVRAVGLIHESMYRSGRMAQVNLEDYIQDLARNLFNVYDLESRQVELKVEADQISLGLDQAVPCGLVLNELMINTLKHAFSLGAGGELLVRARRDPGNMVELIVADNGIGLPVGFQVGEGMGMGLYLVKSLVENQLHGKFELDSNRGVRVRIRFKRLQDVHETNDSAWAEQPDTAA